MQTSKKQKFNKSNKLHALVIVAHPDDESFVFAGTILKFAKENKKVGLVCATRGEKGKDKLGRKFSQKQMAALREKELKNACKILKCKLLEFLDYKDGDLGKSFLGPLAKKLAYFIEKHRPKIILTFGKEGISGHKDHIIIGRAALSAAKKSKVRPLELWLASLPSSRIKVLEKYILARRVNHQHFKKGTLKGVADSKLLKIDVGKFRKEKLLALFCHKSQISLPDKKNIFQRKALPNGRDNFLKHEYFEIIKVKGNP